MFDIEKLRAIAIPDTTWRRQAKYRVKHSKWLRQEAIKKLEELNKIEDADI